VVQLISLGLWRLWLVPFFDINSARIIVVMSQVAPAKAGPPIKVLVVDDDAAHAEAVADSLARVGYECTVATTGAEGMAMLSRDAFEVIVTDLRMKDSTGLDVLAKAKELLPDAEVILVTGHGTVQSAVEAMQQGAFNYLLKPLDLKQLRAVVDSASRAQHLRRANAELSRRLDEKFGFEGVIGNSPQMHEVVDRLRRITRTAPAKIGRLWR
jgi:two-component system response regulator HydG